MTKRRRFNNTNKRGRRKVEPYVLLKRYMLDHPNWKTLHPGARVIYIEIRKRFNGINNGDISLSYREAALIARCGKDSARRHIDELIAHGFIRCSQKGHFRNRWASTWILTNEYLHNQSPTNEWAKSGGK